MDKRKGFYNVAVSVTFKIILLATAIITRRILIRELGNDVNGLNSLYSSIIGFLAVTELGIGSAITYCMYKPIVEGKDTEVAALYNLFNKAYRIIGAVIFIGGIIVLFFLPNMIADVTSLNVNIYITFLIFLVSVVITYFYNSKVALINAYKNNYITNAITSSCRVLRDILQIGVMLVFKSFTLYLICGIVAVIIEGTLINVVSQKKYHSIMCLKTEVDPETRKSVVKNIKAMFAHKIGAVLVNTADSVIISAFIGVVALGKYSNYDTIIVSLVSIIALFFSPLTSVIGHMCITNSSEREESIFRVFHLSNFIIGVVFFLGYYSIINNLVVLLFGNNLELSKPIVMIITLNKFVQSLRSSVLTFRDASGTFYYDRWKPFIEGAINVVLSICFVKAFPEEYQIVGVIVATIITNLLICHIVEPYVLYKYEFKRPVKSYLIRNYGYMAVFCVLLVLLDRVMRSYENEWVELLVNGAISVGISVVLIIVMYICNPLFKNTVISIWKQFKRKIGRE